MTFHEELKICI